MNFFSPNPESVAKLAPMTWVALLGLTLICLASRLAQADNCATCAVLASNVAKQVQYKAKTAEVITKNREYLAKNPTADASIRVKVNSNILVATLRVEAAQNNIETENRQLSEKGCSQCPPKK